MGESSEKNGWNEYQNLIIHRLGVLETRGDKIQESLDDLKLELVMLKTKASAWGAVAGTVGGAAIGTILALLF